MALRLKDAPELQQFILKNVQQTGKILGRGSFGTVEEMKFDHAPCAGKKIHEILVDSRSIGAARLIEKFEQECKLLKELRYPHIVQFMGLCFFEDSDVPVIVMELLDSNIDQWLSGNDRQLPLSLKSTILRDTAKGLNYLHYHDPIIIHRDLTARNVLLTSSMTAKIADLGNAYIVPPQHLTKTMTRAPGTIPYMPPEAFQPNVRYSVKLDMFSFGHLALYVVIQEELYEHLLPPTYTDPRDPDKIIGRSEIERRSYYFNKLSNQFASSHDIPTVIKDCLNNSPHKRPSADEVVQILDETLKEHTDEYHMLAGLNRYDIAEKLKEGRNPTLPHPKNPRIEERIQNEEYFVLELHKSKQGRAHKGVKKWKKYTFCYSAPFLKCYGDMNKDPVYTLDSAKIESVVSITEDHAVFDIHMKGKGKDWILKASSKEEALAWMKVLEPKHAEEGYYDLPSPPPPPDNDISDANAYEHVVPRATRVRQQHGKEEYMPIDPKSFNAPPVYNAPISQQQADNTEILKQNYGQNPDPIGLPQISVESTDDCQAEANPPDVPEGTSENMRRSWHFNEEQLELLMKILQNVTKKDGSNPDMQNLYDEILHQPSVSQNVTKDGSNPDVQNLYDEILHQPSVSQHESSEVWPKSDGSCYVDIDAIEDAYEPIPGERTRTASFYFNIDDKPPLPPKSPRHNTQQDHVKPKPKPPPKPRNRLSVKRRNTSIDELVTASSSISTDMLVLGAHYDDDSDDDEDQYEFVAHRPEWTKARLTVSTDTDLLEKIGPDDEMMDLLNLDKKFIHNLVPLTSGQFGVVRRAIFSTSHGESIPVAVKSVKNMTDKDEKAFINEMKIMSRMLHPNIVRLFGLVLEENWIVLEYLSHGDLGTFLEKNHRPVRRLITYMTDIAMGMHHISNLGLIHRDLAVRNVLVSQDEVCKVADFGLIRSVEAGKYQFSGTTKIPIRWCAPEIFIKKVYYPASDVWSYGIVLWEMVNPTKLPYHQFEDYEVGARIKEGGRQDIPSEYPETVQHIMLACWQFKPEKRPSFQYITALLTKERYMSK